MGQKASANVLDGDSVLGHSFLDHIGTKVGNRRCTRESRRRSWRWFRRSSCLVPGASMVRRLRRRRRAARESGRDKAPPIDQASVGAASCREVYLRRLGIRPVKEPKPTRMPSPKLQMPRSSLSSLDIKCEYFEAESEIKEDIAASFVPSSNSDSSEYSQVSVNSGCNADVYARKVPDWIIGARSQEEQARMKFLQKLSYERVWLPKAQRPPSHQTLIIFDWDDTLVCTSYMNMYGQAGLHSLSEMTRRTMKAIEDYDYKLLELALSLGRTFIITNAIGGWVEGSATAWAPSLLPLLQRVNVVSARSRYEAEYPHDVKKWKAETFLEIRRQLDSQVITNLISLGDSEYEMEATQAMGKEFQNATIKLVKFTQHPSPEELLKQLELVTEEFERIVGNAKNLRVRLQRPSSPQPFQRVACADFTQKMSVRRGHRSMNLAYSGSHA